MRLKLTWQKIFLAASMLGQALQFAFPSERWLAVPFVLVSVLAVVYGDEIDEWDFTVVRDTTADPMRKWGSRITALLSVIGVWWLSSLGDLTVVGWSVYGALSLIGLTALILSSPRMGIARALQNKTDNVGMEVAGKELPRPLLELFKTTDFGLMRGESEMTFTFNDSGERVVLPGAVHLDFNSHTKFLSAYVAAGAQTFRNILLFGQQYKSVLRHFDETATITVQIPGEWDSTGANSLTFSGRVYVYHEQELSVREVADLIDAYSKLGLYLKLRGQNYVVEEWRQRSQRVRSERS